MKLHNSTWSQVTLVRVPYDYVTSYKSFENFFVFIENGGTKIERYLELGMQLTTDMLKWAIGK